ncbi:UNVERIFIED_CONTAM: DNA polymerase III subunit beta [Methylobacteriaceae bacterium AG10]|nr:DNA polymerase III subunit beta [Methylobacteriaceae bacterium AG10]
MKVAVERDNLLAALAHAHRIVAKSDSIPILSTVLMSTEGGRLGITARNADMVAETSCLADIGAPGQVAVPLAPIAELLRRLPAGTAMRLEVSDTAPEIAIRYRRSALSLPTLAVTEFASFAVDADAVDVSIEAATLIRLLEIPLHASNADDQRLFAQGVHLHFAKDVGALCGVATDGRRMTRAVAAEFSEAERFPSVTIGTRSAGELIKLAQDVGGGGVIHLRINERLLCAEADGTRLITKLIEGQYPDYARSIPTDLTKLAAMASHELEQALQRALILADDKDRIVRCEVADGVLSIATRSQKGGAISEAVEVEGGDGISFGMNARMAVEALGALKADVVEISTAGFGSPILMRKRGSSEALCLVMPTRV